MVIKVKNLANLINKILFIYYPPLSYILFQKIEFNPKVFDRWRLHWQKGDMLAPTFQFKSLCRVNHYSFFSCSRMKCTINENKMNNETQFVTWNYFIYFPRKIFYWLIIFIGNLFQQTRIRFLLLTLHYIFGS